MWNKFLLSASVVVLGLGFAAPGNAQRMSETDAAKVAKVSAASPRRASVGGVGLAYSSRAPRPRRYVVTGALVGAGLGAIIGGISALTHPCNDSYCLKDESMPIAVAIPGAAVGALAGWVVYRIAKSRYNYARS